MKGDGRDIFGLPEDGEIDEVSDAAKILQSFTSDVQEPRKNRTHREPVFPDRRVDERTYPPNSRESASRQNLFSISSDERKVDELLSKASYVSDNLGEEVKISFSNQLHINKNPSPSSTKPTFREPQKLFYENLTEPLDSEAAAILEESPVVLREDKRNHKASHFIEKKGRPLNTKAPTMMASSPHTDPDPLSSPLSLYEPEDLSLTLQDLNAAKPKNLSSPSQSSEKISYSDETFEQSVDLQEIYAMNNDAPAQKESKRSLPRQSQLESNEKKKDVSSRFLRTREDVGRLVTRRQNDLVGDIREKQDVAPNSFTHLQNGFASQSPRTESKPPLAMSQSKQSIPKENVGRRDKILKDKQRPAFHMAPPTEDDRSAPSNHVHSRSKERKMHTGTFPIGTPLSSDSLPKVEAHKAIRSIENEAEDPIFQIASHSGIEPESLARTKGGGTPTEIYQTSEFVTPERTKHYAEEREATESVEEVLSSMRKVETGTAFEEKSTNEYRVQEKIEHDFYEIRQPLHASSSDSRELSPMYSLSVLDQQNLQNRQRKTFFILLFLLIGGGILSAIFFFSKTNSSSPSVVEKNPTPRKRENDASSFKEKVPPQLTAKQQEKIPSKEDTRLHQEEKVQKDRNPPDSSPNKNVEKKPTVRNTKKIQERPVPVERKISPAKRKPLQRKVIPQPRARPKPATPKKPQRNPALAKKLSSQGQKLFFAGQLSKARSVLRRAIKADPREPSSYRLLTLVYIRLKDKTRAKRSWRSFKRRFPKSPFVNMLLTQINTLP